MAVNSIFKLINNKQFKCALLEAEKTIYLAAYAHTSQNQAATARLLGVARGTAITKLKGFLSNYVETTQ